MSVHATAELPAVRERSQRRRPPAEVLVAFVVLGAVVLMALVPGLLAPDDPSTISPTQSLLPASSAHPLGTDELGRDILSRVVYGARSALVGPLIIAATTIALGTAIALVTGYFGGWLDSAVSRVLDVLYSLPPLIVAIVLVGVLGGGYWLAILVLITLNLPATVRVIRAAVIERRHLPYVEAAQTLGVSSSRIVVRHLLPNVVPIIAAAFFIQFTYAIVDLSALSFLGLGVPPGSADWGRMLAENRSTVFQNPWGAIAPGLALVFTAVSANLVGDWLYDHFERRGRSR